MTCVYAHIIPVRYAGNATIPKTNLKKEKLSTLLALSEEN